MQPWQQVLTAILGSLVTLAGGLKWFLTWLFKQLSERDQELATARQEFLVALNQERAACDRERESHMKQIGDLLKRADELQEKRVEDARQSAAALYDVANKLRRDRSSTAPESR